MSIISRQSNPGGFGFKETIYVFLSNSSSFILQNVLQIIMNHPALDVGKDVSSVALYQGDVPIVHSTERIVSTDVHYTASI